MSIRRGTAERPGERMWFPGKEQKHHLYTPNGMKCFCSRGWVEQVLRQIGATVVIIVLMLALFFGVAPAQAQAEAELPIEEIRAMLDARYVRNIDWDKLENATLEEIFEALSDPYSGYFTFDEYSDYLTALEGGYGGIGVYVEQVDGYLTVVEAMSGSPGQRAGLLPQDKIIKVNGVDVTGLPIWQSIALIKGEPGTEVKLAVLRDDRVLNFTLKRQLILPKTVTGKMLEDRFGYVLINTFGENTGEELAEVLEDLADQGAAGYLIDLRDNGGGYLQSALAAAELIIPAGPVVQVVNRSGVKYTFRTVGSGLKQKKPLVVLVNEGTASAAELLAAAIRENEAGTLVGTTTFGKASVQEMVELSGGGILKLTVATYLTPKGNDINGIGYVPDVQVEGYELQLKRAKEFLEDKINLAAQHVKRQISLYIGQKRSIIDGGEIFLEAAPFISGERTYVPLRFVSEQLGFQVNWIEDARSIEVSARDRQVVFTLGSNWAITNGTKHLLDAPLIVLDGRSYLPIRYVIELMGGQVEWLPGEMQLNIIYENTTIQ